MGEQIRGGKVISRKESFREFARRLTKQKFERAKKRILESKNNIKEKQKKLEDLGFKGRIEKFGNKIELVEVGSPDLFNLTGKKAKKVIKIIDGKRVEVIEGFTKADIARGKALREKGERLLKRASSREVLRGVVPSLEKTGRLKKEKSLDVMPLTKIVKEIELKKGAPTIKRLEAARAKAEDKTGLRVLGKVTSEEKSFLRGASKLFLSSVFPGGIRRNINKGVVELNKLRKNPVKAKKIISREFENIEKVDAINEQLLNKEIREQVNKLDDKIDRIKAKKVKNIFDKRAFLEANARKKFLLTVGSGGFDKVKGKGFLGKTKAFLKNLQNSLDVQAEEAILTTTGFIKSNPDRKAIFNQYRAENVGNALALWQIGKNVGGGAKKFLKSSPKEKKAQINTLISNFKKNDEAQQAVIIAGGTVLADLFVKFLKSSKARKNLIDSLKKDKKASAKLKKQGLDINKASKKDIDDFFKKKALKDRKKSASVRKKLEFDIRTANEKFKKNKVRRIFDKIDDVLEEIDRKKKDDDDDDDKKRDKKKPFKLKEVKFKFKKPIIKKKIVKKVRVKARIKARIKAKPKARVKTRAKVKAKPKVQLKPIKFEKLKKPVAKKVKRVKSFSVGKLILTPTISGKGIKEKKLKEFLLTGVEAR